VIKLLTEKDVFLLSPALLAYIGDGTYELKARDYLIKKGFRSLKELHEGAVSLVQATAQARALKGIKEELNSREQQIIRRGRNARTSGVPSGTEIMDYRLSTALEALFGYHYLCGNLERIDELWDKVIQELKG